MTLSKTKEQIALSAIFLLLLIPFLGPYRYYNATGFMNDMLTVSCLTLLLFATVIYCKKVVIPHYLSLLAIGGVFLVASTFFNSTYDQNRLNLVIWLVSVGFGSIAISSIKSQYANDDSFRFGMATYMLYSVFTIAIIAFLAFYFANPFVKLTNIFFYYNSSLRMDSFLGQPNLLAILLFLGVASYYYVSQGISSRYISILHSVMLFLIAYCLFATLSRVSILALIVYLLYVTIFAIKERQLKALAKLLTIVGMAYLTYKVVHPDLISMAIQNQWIPISAESTAQIENSGYHRATNLDHKLDEIKRALFVFSQNPIVGAGFGRYGYYSQQLTLAGWPVYIVGFPYHSHNIISQTLAEFGAIGGAALLSAIVLLMKLLVQSYQSKAHLLLFAVIIIFGLNALFEYALWNLNFAILFFVLVASFSNDKKFSFKVLKTPLLKLSYTVLFLGFSLILVSRWSIINTLNTIFSQPENVVYAQTMTEDSLMGLDFSSIYLAGIKTTDSSDKEYAKEVTKMENWRPTDMVYYRKVQLNIGNNNVEDITSNIDTALKLGAKTDTFEALLKVDCQKKNQACLVAESYLNSLQK